MGEKDILLKYNLQLFAKDGPGGEKTEAPTAKKLTDARKDGQVAKSKEIINAAYFLIIFYTFRFILGIMGEGIVESFNSVYNAIPTYATNISDINIGTVGMFMSESFFQILKIVAPVLIVSFVVTFVGEVIQVGWKPTAKPMQPKFNKLNPLKGLKRLFSTQSLINLLKSAGIISICFYIVYNEWMDNNGLLFQLYDTDIIHGIVLIGNITLDIAVNISMIYLIIGIIDYIFQKHKFNEDMKMTKQEVKDEYKNSEGDPTVRQQQKRRMREASQRRMMKSLPEADVVITNPTHYAVAIKYDLEIAKAPIVIAKGEDFLAQKIKEIARENNVEIYENKPLARALYSSVEIGDEVPEELYQAVAEVLAFVYSLKNKR